MLKKIKKIGVNKIAYVLIFALAFAMLAPLTAEADSILDRVRAAQETDSVSKLEERAADAGNKFIVFLRNTAILLAVIMFVVVAYTLIFSPNVKTIADCKGRVAALVMAIAIAIMAEEIVGTVMAWLG